MGTQNVTVKVVPWWGSFWGILSVIFLACVVAVGGYILVVKAITFLWPTLKWLVPVLTGLAITVWLLYRTTQAPDEVAKSYRVYQAVVMNLGTLIILAILIVNTRTVGL